MENGRTNSGWERTKWEVRKRGTTRMKVRSGGICNCIHLVFVQKGLLLLLNIYIIYMYFVTFYLCTIK